jgi:ATP-binding cassette subfamily F protein uup
VKNAPVTEVPEIREKPAIPKKKLSYNEQRELAALPERCAALEAEQADLQSRLENPDIYVREPDAATAATVRLAQLEEELLHLLERWTELES